MIILGVDPGTAITGYGVIEYTGNKFIGYECGVIQTQASLSLPERLGIIYKKLNDIVERYNPQHMAVEELYFSKNTRTALAVGQARGVVLLTGVQSNLFVGEYTPLQVKQSVVGYGRAKKEQVQRMVATILGLEKVPTPDDAADAYAVAICHAHSYKLNSLISGEIR